MTKANRIRLICYVLTLALALCYPIKKIVNFECPDVAAQEYLFKCTIVDPYDPMRGRYVRLGFVNQTVKAVARPVANEVPGKYLVLTKGPNSEPKYLDIIKDPAERPEDCDILKLKGCYYTGMEFKNGKMVPGNGNYVIILPFDRFYLNENLAPAAETLYANATRRGAAFAKVKIYANGEFVLADLIIDGKSIRELLKCEK